MDRVMRDLHPTNLRYLFYLVTPNETTFDSIDDVPDYTQKVTVWVVILLLTEMLLLDKSRYSFNDTVTSSTSALLYLLVKISGKYISAALYTPLYDYLHIIDLDARSPWVWLLCFFTMDFVYYLAHRASHEVGILWAFHQMHHSSEYYNLSTSLRKSIFMEVGYAGFDLLQTVIIPPQVFLPHKYFNLLAQFWLHTELVPYLGPLEYIINTPSAHRVHHGRNPYCIDKNYAGTLIIFDRLFGTYAREKNDEPISYGLVENVKSFNALWLQLFDLKVYLWDKGAMKDEDQKSLFPRLADKLFTIVGPPGHFPGVKIRRCFWWWCLVDSTEGIPEVDHSEPKYNPPLRTTVKLYITFQLLFLISIVLPFYETRLRMDWPMFAAQLTIIVSTIQIFGHYFDNDPLAPFHDRLRCLGLLVYVVFYRSTPVLVTAVLSLAFIQYLDHENAQKLSKEEHDRTQRMMGASFDQPISKKNQ